jgi:hypothetical protein
MIEQTARFTTRPRCCAQTRHGRLCTRPGRLAASICHHHPAQPAPRTPHYPATLPAMHLARPRAVLRRFLSLSAYVFARLDFAALDLTIRVCA